jgi:hypothetical protein
MEREWSAKTLEAATITSITYRLSELLAREASMRLQF